MLHTPGLLYQGFKFRFLGIHRFEDIEIRRKVFLVNLFSTVGFLFLLSFGINSLVDDRLVIAAGILAGAFITVLNFLVVRFTLHYQLACDGVSFIILSISLFLLYTGGVEQTGPLWTYVSVPLVLFLQGPRRGLFILLLYLALAMGILYVPADQDLPGAYSDAYILRYLASYVALIIMSWLYEKSRMDAHVRWRALSQRFESQARTDALTGISNRRDILEKLEYENLRAKRRGEIYSLLLLDIDFFKRINDDYGHDTGDRALTTIAESIGEALFERDLFGRWGGEEFLIILPDTAGEDATNVAKRIKDTIAGLNIRCQADVIQITASIGIASSDGDYDIQRYMATADRRLYRAKHRGRNCVVGDDEAAVN